MAAWPWMLGGAAVAGYAWSKSRPAAPLPTRTSSTEPLTLPGRWVWPVATWRGRRPVISDGFGSPRPGGARHEGVDVMFARVADDRFATGSPNGTRAFVMPDNGLAVAAADGVVWSCGWTPRGWSIVIDHTALAPVATYYTHLALPWLALTQRARSGQRVRAGQPIGIIGADPRDPGGVKHLHFALWRGGPADAIDPAPFMRTWGYAADPRDVPSLVARNAGLSYRPVGARGDPYPAWVRTLRGKSGVYVIRERGELVYVGESHTDNLYETLTRHFQTWRRWKGYWRGQYGEGHDPGLTYDRGACEVAVRVLPPDRALAEEARLIARLAPRDNLRGQVDDDEAVPF